MNYYTNEEIMKCTHCGKEIAKDSNSCEYCGTKLKKDVKWLQLFLGMFLLIGIPSIYVTIKNSKVNRDNNKNVNIESHITFEQNLCNNISQKLIDIQSGKDVDDLIDVKRNDDIVIQLLCLGTYERKPTIYLRIPKDNNRFWSSDLANSFVYDSSLEEFSHVCPFDAIYIANIIEEVLVSAFGNTDGCYMVAY